MFAKTGQMAGPKWPTFLTFLRGTFLKNSTGNAGKNIFRKGQEISAL